MNASELNPTRQLHNLGQSLWLDNITRPLLDDGTLARYIQELAITGLTSNPSTFEKAIVGTDAYNAAIGASRADSGEALFNELALGDLTRAADLFAGIHQATGGVDGWVSLEVSPLLAHDAEGSLAAAVELHQRGQRPNLFIKIPGTPAGVTAIEEAIFAGIPVNVTLLFSCAQYLAAANAYLRGIERRIAAGLDPVIGSVASVFVSRWDAAVATRVDANLHNRLGIAVAGRTYGAYRELLASARWQKLAAAGAKPQRLLWASTSTKDPKAPDTLYLEALAAPDTINTIPENTLHAFADHGRVGTPMATDSSAAEQTIAAFFEAGIDINALASQLQSEGVAAFAQSWHKLMQGIADTRKRIDTQA